MRYAEITRQYHQDVTTGWLRMWSSRRHAIDYPDRPLLKLCTLELPWRGNQPGASCIPEGLYITMPRYSARHDYHFHILDVPDRTYILFHVANYTSQLEGCIAVGRNHTDIDRDGIMDVANSRAAMDDLLYYGGDGFILRIKK